jgi:peptide/nickel transport system permease protein
MDQAQTTALDAALKLVKETRLEEARLLLAEIIRRDPNNEQAWHLLSFALTDHGQQAYALRRVLGINPNNRAARSQLSRISLPSTAAPAAPTLAGARREPFSLERPPEAQPAIAPPEPTVHPERTAGRPALRTLFRIVKYVTVRALVLSLMVAIGVFLSIIVINYGGYIDKIVQANIDEALNFMSLSMPGATIEEVAAATEQARWGMEEAAGLHQPFLLRCARWFAQGLTLDWGQTFLAETRGGTSHDVRSIILERMPNTLFLVGTANLLLFFSSVLAALALSKRYGSLWDKIAIALSPISSIPNWIYGVVLILIFAAELRLLPFGGMFDTFPPATAWGYIPIVLKHMILPITAILLATFFQSVYAWRTFFLIHAGEDYVDLARAKGLPPRMLEWRYVLKPALPYIITTFALLMISFWQGVIVLEVFFNWPGIGQLFIKAVKGNAREVVIGLIVMFAYLLALTVFLLDIVYALVDPRVRIGSPAAGKVLKAPRAQKRRFRFWSWRRRPAVPRQAKAPVPGWNVAKAKGTEGRIKTRRARAGDLWVSLREIGRYPSAIVGLVIIVLLIGVSIYTLIAIPYDQAVAAWQPENEDNYIRPRTAMPAWVNLFRKDDLPPTIIMDSRSGTGLKTVEQDAKGVSTVTISFTLDYQYGGFPQDMVVRFFPKYDNKRPFVSMTWLTPDGRRLDLGSFSVVTGQRYIATQHIPDKYLSEEVRKKQSLRGRGGLPAAAILFADPAAAEPVPLKGTYTLRLDGLTFEAGGDMDAEVVFDGQVYGLAGTDDARRDLLVGLLWGMPIALAFGLIGAVATSLASMVFAAVGSWLGGWVDDLVQRVTEINMILPSLPIAITVYYVYSKSIWAILGVMVLLSIFGSAVKNYRAIFVQVKEAPYVEAAQAYGASNGRIILRYLVPRIMPLLIPQLVILIPTYVFFEATLAYLGVSDLHIPTWGKIVYDAITKGAFEGYYYWVLEPIGLMMLTGLAFAMVGFALDSILNPRLRSR